MTKVAAPEKMLMLVLSFSELCMERQHEPSSDPQF